MRTSKAFLVFPLLLAGLARTQETTATSALTITTDDPMIVRAVLRMFESDAAAPKVGDGSVAVLSLDDGGNINVREAEGSGWLRVDARPAQLMDLFAAQIGQTRQQAQAMGGFVLGQQGFGFEEIDQIVTGLFGFPKQIDALSIVIPTEYEPGAPMAVDVDLHPKTGTWLGSLVGNLQPLESGVPTLAAAGDPMVRLDANIDMARIMPQVLPMLGVLSGMGQTDKEAKATAAKMMRSFYEATSGTMSMAFDFQNGGKLLMGLSDPERIRGLMADPAYLAYAKTAAEAGGMAEATVEPAALTHREVPIMRTKVVFDDPNMAPFGEDGTESFGAVVGNLMVTSMFVGAKAEIQALIDDVLDEKVKRSQLAQGALMKMHVNVDALVGYLAQQGMPAEAEDAPASVDATLTRSEKGLRLRVDIR